MSNGMGQRSLHGGSHAGKMIDKEFHPITAATFTDIHSLHNRQTPAVFRGLASHWPAVRQWDFSALAALAPDISVKLVDGNRERESTQFVNAPLRTYLESLHGHGPSANQALYLKEFDLLQTIPQLRHDLNHTEIFPSRGIIHSLQSWIGPAGGRTGLHYDYLDNLAVQIMGKKRFYLVQPGTVEDLGKVAQKYDPWARLASVGAIEISNWRPDAVYSADLAPGDVLYVPAGWWHEVFNLTPGILFGGFYGKPTQVLTRWTWVCARDLLHRMGWIGHGNCTCHPIKYNA